MKLWFNNPFTAPPSFVKALRIIKAHIRWNKRQEDNIFNSDQTASWHNRLFGAYGFDAISLRGPIWTLPRSCCLAWWPVGRCHVTSIIHVYPAFHHSLVIESMLFGCDIVENPNAFILWLTQYGLAGQCSPKPQRRTHLMSDFQIEWAVEWRGNVIATEWGGIIYTGNG